MTTSSIPQAEQNSKSVFATQKSTSCCYSRSLYFICATINLLLLILLQIEVLTSTLSACPWPFSDEATLHHNESITPPLIASATDLDRARSMLRDSITFLPLKDLRFAKDPMSGHTWFMSSINDTFAGDEAQHLYFPSEASKGRLLCLSASDASDGTNNSYALAWPEALPHNATLLAGLTFVSDTYYDYANLWHSKSAVLPFVSWHQSNGCTAPERWVLFHWGELRTSMGSWVRNLTTAAIGGGEVKIEDLGRYGAACFEKAVVFRHNEGAMTKERKREVYDMMRCRARAYCRVNREAGEEEEKAIRMTLLLRLGSRSFKDEGKVIEIFERECKKVDGCVIKVAWGNNMTFCDQVKLMSETDILVSPHGCQLTNLFLMDKNSSVMEFYPKGWRELAGVGQYIYRWMSKWAGMQHKGAWRDPDGDNCPHTDKLECFLFYKDKQIGHDEVYFAEWATKVLGEVKKSKLSEAEAEAEAEAGRESKRLPVGSSPCPCD
ncbi:hypothetical protein Cni_G28772 [Canna indica]|uniref:Glycosyltransferase 61 catalytic domain-containing protein n=1 Tax=Canna indica TaxID=4628 RepID=A0AAQ3L4J7_9LILI|nr:hypothetical protein Cni_G28772 [Canna indica]